MGIGIPLHENAAARGAVVSMTRLGLDIYFWTSFIDRAYCGLQTMASTPPIVPEYNSAGAVIFVLYVISALVFTGVIIGILLSSPQWHQKLCHASTVQIFAALSVLSFSVLSYHMLSFLILSYESWASAEDIRIPQSFFGHNGLANFRENGIDVRVWDWLISSALFRDFAETICGDSARYWWTLQALLATMTWNVFMSIEGENNQPSASLTTQPENLTCAP